MIKSKIFKMSSIFLLLTSMFTTFAHATDTTNNTINSTTVSSVSSVMDSGLVFSDIINILLIAVGVVIILLAIAILTRLKK